MENVSEIIEVARNYADANSVHPDGFDWQNLCDSRIEELAASPEIADRAIELNNFRLLRAAGVL